MYRSTLPTLGAPRSTWGYFSSSENDFSLGSATRPDGSSYDLNISPIRWNYDDYYSMGGSCAPGNGGTGADNAGFVGGRTDGCQNNNAGVWTNDINELFVNTNQIGMRIINDGTNFKFYLNPDPDDNDANPNEYMLVGQSPATFTSDMGVMVGVEAARFDTEMQWAEFDNFLVRSVADSDVANTRVEISPNSATVGASVNFKMIMNPTFTANDAGIAEIKVVKPSSYAAWDTSGITVYTDHGTGAATLM